MLFSVEVCCGAEELASTMLKMREWLDSRRFEPDVFRHTVDETKITIHLSPAVQDRRRGHCVRRDVLGPTGLNVRRSVGPLRGSPRLPLRQKGPLASGFCLSVV